MVEYDSESGKMNTCRTTLLHALFTKRFWCFTFIMVVSEAVSSFSSIKSTDLSCDPTLVCTLLCVHSQS